MKLSYGMQISNAPIKLSICTLRKPTLGEISELTFEDYGSYLALLSMTPEKYYAAVKEDEDRWNTLSDSERATLKMYDIIISDNELLRMYLDILSFFIVEPLIFKDGYFLTLKREKSESEVEIEDVLGAISRETFQELVDVILLICGNEPSKPEEKPKFKNKKAEKMYMRMQSANVDKKEDINMSIPNIISAVCAMHNSINYTNVWSLTIYQLIDTFNRLRTNKYFEIDSTRVSVWGDEKKTFDGTLWYKNEFDKKL